MTNRHRVKAFTIMELSIAMLIAGIVIGITYTAYTIINRSYLDFKTKNDHIAVLNRVDQLLKRDFERGNDIYAFGSKILISRDTHTPVNYEIDSAYIIRISGRIDTFKVNTGHLKTTFEGMPNSNEPTETTNITDENNLIDELSFTVNFQGESIPYHYHKQYSSFNLISRNPDANH